MGDRISAATLLGHMSLDSYPGVHVLGCMERRVTVYSQQVRALNLVYALISEGMLGAGRRVAVIGGGVAGVTFAAGAAAKGCEVTLLEGGPALFNLFSNCQKRWLHPQVYDWPSPGTLAERAGLPVMDWRADSAAAVVEQLRGAWDRLLADRGELVTVHTGFGCGRPERLGNKRVHLSWNPGARSGEFDAVVIAVGFGIERRLQPLPVHSYWQDDALDQRELGPGARYLVSGVGDGGLTDVLRASIKDFRHERIVETFGLDTRENLAASQLGDWLLTAEAEARRLALRKDMDGVGTVLHEAYFENIGSRAAFVDDALRARIRTDRKVALNGTGRYPLDLGASVLNRLLVSRLLALGVVDYERGEIAAPLQGWRGWRRVGPGDRAPRHGAGAAEVQRADIRCLSARAGAAQSPGSDARTDIAGGFLAWFGTGWRGGLAGCGRAHFGADESAGQRAAGARPLLCLPR